VSIVAVSAARKRCRADAGHFYYGAAGGDERPLRLGSKGWYNVYYTAKPWSRLEVNPKPRGRKLPPRLAVVGANGGHLRQVMTYIRKATIR